MDKFMNEAIKEAQDGIRNGHGGPFGVCIVRDGKIIGRGHNKVILNHDCTCHGEMEAIRDACKNTNSFDLSGAHLYTTGMPCPMCLGAIQWASIEKLYYGCSVEDNASIGFRDDLFAEGININHEKLTFSIEQLERDECWKVLEEYHNMDKELY
ncbi:MAG: nucleoside deaminase [Clostridia bacterium]|nr:nucleoside deaminase [Clostridia bacterium]